MSVELPEQICVDAGYAGLTKTLQSNFNIEIANSTGISKEVNDQAAFSAAGFQFQILPPNAGKGF